MDLLDMLFSTDINEMDAGDLSKWLQEVEFVDQIARAISDFNELVFKDLLKRHDVPADIRIILHKYNIIATELAETLTLATSDDYYMVLGERKEDA
jgi:hypothetical protein